MRISIGLALCILLGGLSVACSPMSRITQANSEGARSAGDEPAKVKPSPLRSEWRIGAPSSHASLTVFPVLSQEPESARGYITLDQGLRSGKVIITEIGQDGRSRRIDPRRQTSEDADVNKLAITNRTGKTLILVAGEVLIGGKQDRIVGHDCLVASANEPVEIDVFCVEQGRWEDRPAFGRSSGTGGGTGSRIGAGSSAGAGGGGGLTSTLSTAPGVIAAPDVREKAQAKKDQSAVWSNVTETVTVNSSRSATLTLNRVYENRNVTRKLRAYERTLRGKLAARNVVGAVVAVGGEIIAADVFASPSLFQAYWPKLLKSYALQAISTPIPQGRRLTQSDARGFLARSDGASSANGREGVYRLTEYQSDTDASFELEHYVEKPALIHFNRVNKR